MKHQQSGYILMLSLMMIALMTFVGTYLLSRTTGYGPAMRAFVDQQKALELAHSGLQLAIEQLSAYPKAKEQQGQQAASTFSPEQEAVTLLKKIEPELNQWQSVSLKKERDGVTGTIQFCIICEQGKLDINSMYDFSKQQFISPDGKTDARKALQNIFESIKTIMGGENLFKPFEKFLKERQYKLDDVTQLLTIKEFDVFRRRVWYEPSASTKNEASAQQIKQPVYLTDIFTVWSRKPILEPWLLSDSISTILGCKRPHGAASAEVLTEALKQFKMNAAWATDWDKILKPLYGKEYKVIPAGIEAYFSPTFEATIFSVLSYGKVGTITRKLCAIVERSASKSKNKQAGADIKIRKLYWL